MVKGLFAVYRDEDAPLRTASSSTSSANNKNTNNNAKPRRKPLTSKLSNKENLDPVSTSLRQSPSGKCGGKKAARPSHQPAPSDSNNLVLHVPSKNAHLKSDNGICTGTLTTRTLPLLPPLEDDDSPLTTTRSRPTTRLTKTTTTTNKNNASTSRSTLFVNFETGSEGVETREISLPPIVGGSSFARGGRGEVESSSGTPNSAKDSGYAPSVEEEEELEGDQTFIVLNRGNGEESDGDRRARALTESPLAEVRFDALSIVPSTAISLITDHRRN